MKIGSVKISAKVLILSIVGAVVLIVAGWGLPFVMTGASESRTIYIYPGLDSGSLRTSLTDEMGVFGGRVCSLLDMLGVNLDKRVGAYRVEQGDSPLRVARMIRNHMQTPVKFSFNNVRTKQQFADRVGEKFLMDADDMLAALCDSAVCAKYGKTPETIVAMLQPDSYEFYWTVTAEEMLSRFASYNKQFWNDERCRKAAALGLTPDEVVTVASIAEEETAKSDERGKVGRLYINRLQSGMPLQADPTVKYAIGDFSIKRITVAMTHTDNPYNTYRYAGLPPGPIRFVEKASIDAVLNSDQSDYIYMCAKEDFSGYHNFTKSYSEHLANAARYRNELDKRGIK